jgi:O-antigen ligase
VLLRPRQENWKQHATLGVCVALVIGFLVWVGGNEFTKRLASIQAETQQELSGGTRISIDRDCLRMWWARPLIGWGLGTFPTAYPQFRTFYTTFFVNEAHNDYLQLLTETGVVGFGIAVWFLVVTIRRAWAKLDNWTENVNGALTVAALLGCVGILVHSFLDFNLQIPANAALFYVLCAVAASAPLQESQRRRVRRRGQSEDQTTAGNSLA